MHKSLEKYIHKIDGTVVRAIQFNKEAYKHEVFLKLIPSSSQGFWDGEYLKIVARTGEAKRVKESDYIVLENSGDFHVLDTVAFKETYQKVDEGWLVRVKVEQIELNRKLDALKPAVSQTVKPAAMSEKQWELLNRQWFHMTQYNQILIERIAEAEQQ